VGRGVETKEGREVKEGREGRGKIGPPQILKRGYAYALYLGPLLLNFGPLTGN
jgi:hypothetical protein